MPRWGEGRPVTPARNGGSREPSVRCVEEEATQFREVLRFVDEVLK